MMKTQLAQNKDDLHVLGADDLLSRLPDDILVSIVSSLPLNDAAATSLLSRRWRYLWCQTDHLVFEDKERWKLIQNRLDLGYSNVERDKYMSWVNHIIDQHKSPTIHKFKICFGLNENAKGAINKWIKFAISKDVQTLELNLLNLTINDRTWGNYRFPDKIFDRKCGFSLKRHSFNVPVMAIKSLKSLIMKFVDVNDEDLRIILSNCPVLEHLSILGSHKLVKAGIHGKGLALKNLDLKFCHGLEYVEICDSNIVFFDYWGSSPITLRLGNLQKLEKICISIPYSWKKINDTFCQIFCCVPYLQVLEVFLCDLKGSIEVLPFPKLQKLKQLTIRVEEDVSSALLVLPFLVEACPNLHKLTIMKISWCGAEKTNWEVSQMVKKPHQRVEVVEIVNYCVGTSDLELVMYLIQNFVALKKLVIKPFKKLGYRETKEEKNAARNRAREELEPRTPDGVELVIL